MVWRRTTQPPVPQPVVQNQNTVPVELPTLPVKETKKEEQKPREVFEVVVKIPTQEIRRVQGEDGIIINYITVEEYQLMKMTEEINSRRD